MLVISTLQSYSISQTNKTWITYVTSVPTWEGR